MSRIKEILKSIDKRSDEEKFLSKFNIDKEKFAGTGIKWNELEKIRNRYSGYKSSLEPTATDIVNRLFKAKNVHSIRYRIKNEDHLIEKIVRKRINDPTRIITIDNYKEEINDLIGVRVLHLYKSNWQSIHRYILNTYEVNEQPIAYIRGGDDPKLYEHLECKIEIHPHNYRSVHYILKVNPTKETHFAEVQVRTIFEEGWSEIDHDIRYPYNANNEIFGQYLDMFNRISGSADEMGTFIKNLQMNFIEQKMKHWDELKSKEETIKSLEKQIEELKISDKDKGKLTSDVEQLSMLFPSRSLNDLFYLNYAGLNLIQDGNKIYDTKLEEE